MTLFESTIRKLNIPRCVIDDIITIRNICMEAEQPQPKQPDNQQQNATQKQAQPKQPDNQQQNATQTQAQPKQPDNQQQNATQTQAQPKQPYNQQQNATQAQNQTNTNQQEDAPQEQHQNTEDVPQNIEETQVDVKKLMNVFNDYMSGCQKKLTNSLISKFGQDAQTAIDNVKSYAESNSQIDFNKEVAPFLSVNGNPVSDPKVLDEIRKQLAKYFGANFVSSTPEEKKQETEKPQEQQEKTQVQKQEQTQAQPAK